MDSADKAAAGRSGDAVAVENLVLRYARDHPDLGQAKVAAALRRAGHAISPSGVRYIWQRHGLETTYKRLRALQRGNRRGEAPALSVRQQEVLRRAEAGRRIARFSASVRPEEGDDPQRAELILLAAARLFAERGYEATSVRDIAAAVGVRPGSIYHHYASKEDLFVSVHEEGFRQLTAQVEQAMAPGPTPRAKLLALCTAHIEALVAVNPMTIVAGRSLFHVHAPGLERRLGADRRKYEALWRRTLSTLALPAPVDRSVARQFLLGALNWVLLWYRPGHLSPAQLAAQLLAQWLPPDATS